MNFLTFCNPGHVGYPSPTNPLGLLGSPGSPGSPRSPKPWIVTLPESLLVRTARSLGGQYVSLCSTDCKVYHKTNPKRTYAFTFFSDTKRLNQKKTYSFIIKTWLTRINRSMLVYTLSILYLAKSSETQLLREGLLLRVFCSKELNTKIVLDILICSLVKIDVDIT